MAIRDFLLENGKSLLQLTADDKSDKPAADDKRGETVTDNQLSALQRRLFKPFRLVPLRSGAESPNVALISLAPGNSILHSLSALRRSQKLRGLIIKAYGSGNGPTDDSVFVDQLKELLDHGVAIAAVTECITGHIDSSYTTDLAGVRCLFARSLVNTS